MQQLRLIYYLPISDFILQGLNSVQQLLYVQFLQLIVKYSKQWDSALQSKQN